MILQWSQQVPAFKLVWLGPNTINTDAISTMQDVEKKIAVISGPKGDKGDAGTPGTPGVDGAQGSDLKYTWSPPSAQSIWVIAHNLGKYPSVTVLDSTGRLVTPEVTYLNINSVEVSFAFATSGTAYLN